MRSKICRCISDESCYMTLQELDNYNKIIIFLLHRHIAVFLDDNDVSTLPLPTHLRKNIKNKYHYIKIIYCRLCYWLQNAIKAQCQILVHFHCSSIVIQLHLDYILMLHVNCLTLRLHNHYIEIALLLHYIWIAF